ncbi:MAG: Tetratricopeptide 2 repeat protein, partial [Deltaproteobacteria bacterium]|nr:Tetratricopeptide 2 repeat protein [Deltaproteobacteria bacterium]
PQPASASGPTAQQRATDLPAPKGFFDDLPGRVNPATPKAPTVATPKGFFDDLLQPSGDHADTVSQKLERSDLLELGDPLELGEPLELELNKPAQEPTRPKQQTKPPAQEPTRSKQQTKRPAQEPTRPKQQTKRPAQEPTRPARPTDSSPLELDSSALELDGPDLDAPLELDLMPGPTPGPTPAPAHAPGAGALSLESGPELDLGDRASQFDDLDLSRPSSDLSKPSDEGIRIAPAKPPSGAAPQPAKGSRVAERLKAPELSLELAEPRAAPTPAAQKRKHAPVEAVDPAAAQRRAKRMRIVLLATLVVGGLGAGGFYMYRQHAAKQALEDQTATELANAQTAMLATDPKHWDRAHAAAVKVLELDGKNPIALGIAAEAQLAAALADGTAVPTKLANARKYIASAVESSSAGPQIARAQALSALAAHQPERAVERLRPLSDATPKDAVLALYLGWALAAHGDEVEAIKAFDRAVENAADSIKLHALYGRGLARLDQSELDGARADFTAVLALDKVHIGAQIGLAAVLPYAQAQQQETDLLAILARKDLEVGDQRAVVHGWVLAGELARRGNRADVARERFRNALTLAPEDVPALTGLAEVELRDGKLVETADLLKKALELSPDDVHALLVQSELALVRKDLSDAETRLDGLAARKPPPPVLEQARIKRLIGRLLEAKGQDLAAADAYVEAAKLAGELDLTPTLAAVTLLSRLAAAEHDPTKAGPLRERVELLLGSLATNATKDPLLALALGMAYLQSGDAAQAEPWLRRAVEGRSKDVEPHYQLAKALAKLSHPEEAIQELQKASDLDPKRTEIGLELARTYEAAGRDTDAATLYGKLLAAAKDPSIELRARAGRFFARTSKIEQAVEQGTQILLVDPGHAAGLFLKAEGLLAAGRIEDARKSFTQAAEADPDPQYLDGQGRAAEADALKNNNTAAQDAALRAYMAASLAAPTMFNPLAGTGRLYVLRHEAAKAVKPLLDAYKIKPDAEVAYNLGLAYVELQQEPTAIQWLQRSLQSRPHAEAYWNLGQLLANRNQVREAAAAIEEATRMALVEERKTAKPISWLTDALYKLGRVQKDVPNDAAAREAWEKYMGRTPPPGAARNEVQQALATSLKRP